MQSSKRRAADAEQQTQSSKRRAADAERDAEQQTQSMTQCLFQVDSLQKQLQGIFDPPGKKYGFAKDKKKPIKVAMEIAKVIAVTFQVSEI